MDLRIDVVVADIATLARDAIVNAANESLLGGGGVDGAIHRAAGPELLASCYVECLKLAVVHGVETIAFPAVSTGVYGFPRERAARIAVDRTLEHLARNELPARVTFCCFAEEDAEIYRAALETRT